MTIRVAVKGVSTDLTRATGGSTEISLGDLSPEDVSGLVAKLQHLVAPLRWAEDGLCPPQAFLDGPAGRMTVVADNGILYWEERDIEITPAEVVASLGEGQALAPGDAPVYVDLPDQDASEQSISKKKPASRRGSRRASAPGTSERKVRRSAFKYGFMDLIRLIFATLGGLAAFSPMIFLAPHIQSSARGDPTFATIMIGAFFLAGAGVVFLVILAPTINK